ncbi:hypothetical protein Q3G72_011503 [Acer saccharum]|nr:hypothetical protein Q3G72_011503 [Acer saccharum]
MEDKNQQIVASYHIRIFLSGSVAGSRKDTFHRLHLLPSRTLQMLKKIESDEATVVKWIKEGLNLESEYGTVVSEINCLIDKETETTVCAISKEANKVANGLAEKALRIDENAYWMEEFPNCIRKEVETDMSG